MQAYIDVNVASAPDLEEGFISNDRLAEVIDVQTHLNGCWQWQVRSITQLNKDKRYVFLLILLVTS
jgi:hypothetical protein